jgi:hypothetical protein
MKKIVLLAAALVALAGCSTTIKTSQEIAPNVRASVTVEEATAIYATGVTGPDEVAPKLQQAVLAAASKRSGGSSQVKLKITITDYKLVNAGMRALIGAMGGSNTLNVEVEVVDAASGRTIGRYEVKRDSNPGGYGIFYSQADALIDETAKGVVEGLYGT